MGCDTCGKIKGYVNHKDIVEFIKKNYDNNVKDGVKKWVVRPLSKCDWEYKINEHSEDNENWYSVNGFITFKYKDEERMLFYDYDNLNSYENLEYYTERGLEDMVKAETTYISLGYWGNSVAIIKEIIANFNGGWIDEDDCDGDTYYEIKPKIS